MDSICCPIPSIFVDDKLRMLLLCVASFDPVDLGYVTMTTGVQCHLGRVVEDANDDPQDYPQP